MAGLMTHQYKKLSVTMKMWMQFNVMPRTTLGVDAVRNKATLMKLITDHIEPGSTIYSDGWSAYKCLSDHGYLHYMLNINTVSKQFMLMTAQEIHEWFIQTQ